MEAAIAAVGAGGSAAGISCIVLRCQGDYCSCSQLDGRVGSQVRISKGCLLRERLESFLNDAVALETIHRHLFPVMYVYIYMQAGPLVLEALR